MRLVDMTDLPDRYEHPGGGVTYPRHIERVLEARRIWDTWHGSDLYCGRSFNLYEEPRTSIGRFRRAVRQFTRPGELT